jgi:nicotinate phosphoribosyltransferase
MPRRLPVRVPTAVFHLPVEQLRRGDFSDTYFLNIRDILERLSRRRYRYMGSAPLLRHDRHRAAGIPVGTAPVEMQMFTRRRPFSILCGVEHARAILERAAGSFDRRGRWRSAREMAVWAAPEGLRIRPHEPALVIRGRYSDFCILETPILGVLARETRVATNVYRALVAARGKPVFFFPARMDLPATQSSDGWAYRTGVGAYRRESRRKVPLLVSTRVQAERWGGTGAGTVAHSYILCFLGDTAEAMVRYAESLPVTVQRVALVDTTGDCVGESLRTARAFFDRHLQALRAGQGEIAERFRLHGVRADTAAEVRDRSVPPSGAPGRGRGVTESLVRAIRSALDGMPDALQGREARLARDYVRSIKIVVSGGFDPERIARFERDKAPVDIYGVGSWFLRGEANDFTADVVRMEIGGRWETVCKVGRRPMKNRALRRLL